MPNAGRPGGCGRFAPSPTGELHLGSLRTALIAWLVARTQGDRFLVRIEDLDRGRVRERHVSGQLADLAALGIDWDGEPARQSERDALYAGALARLRAMDLTYPCFCSRREIREAASAQHGESTEAPYPGTCARLDPEEAARRVAAGADWAERLRAGSARVAVEDRLGGRIESEVDDFVLVRRDGAFAYNLAVVVDDDEQGITEVVRGADLLPSTPRQALLYDLLGLRRPVWTHVPLVLGTDRSRLAKRHGSVTLADLAADGHDPVNVLRALADSIGIEAPAAVRAADLIPLFELDALPREPWVVGERGLGRGPG